MGELSDFRDSLREDSQRETDKVLRVCKKILEYINNEDSKLEFVILKDGGDTRCYFVRYEKKPILAFMKSSETRWEIDVDCGALPDMHLLSEEDSKTIREIIDELYIRYCRYSSPEVLTPKILRHMAEGFEDFTEEEESQILDICTKIVNTINGKSPRYEHLRAVYYKEVLFLLDGKEPVFVAICKNQDDCAVTLTPSTPPRSLPLDISRSVYQIKQLVEANMPNALSEYDLKDVERQIEAFKKKSPDEKARYIDDTLSDDIFNKK